MSFKFRYTILLSVLCTSLSCTKLDKKIYSVTPIDEFWQTDEQIKAGIAPAYQALQAIPDGNLYYMITISSDETVCPTRGGDWYDGGVWQQLWLHNWDPNSGIINSAWQEIFNGIGKINFILYQVNGLAQKPATIDQINAELKTLRAYFYYLAMDNFGNVPLVTDYNTDPNSVTNSTQAEIFKFIEHELADNLALLPESVDATTYGKVTKWMAHALFSKLYLNAATYTGSARWQDCIDHCDAVIAADKYNLESDYFANFKVDNRSSEENIFVVPSDYVNISNNWKAMNNLHYQSQSTFGLNESPWNGFCAPPDFYKLFDTSSVYSASGGNVYRSYLDARTGQYLVGQQFSTAFSYPPNKNILYSAADQSLYLRDAGNNILLNYSPLVNKISDTAGSFRMAGARSIKYFPEAGATNQSNDQVIYRYADILLTKAEALLRLGNTADALPLVNQVRERAYGNSLHNWTGADLTLSHILDERGRELATELSRRQDLVRFGKFGDARNPDKPADAADGHLSLFPIPAMQITANANLKQNPGY